MLIQIQIKKNPTPKDSKLVAIRPGPAICLLDLASLEIEVGST